MHACVCTHVCLEINVTTIATYVNTMHSYTQEENDMTSWLLSVWMYLLYGYIWCMDVYFPSLA